MGIQYLKIFSFVAIAIVFFGFCFISWSINKHLLKRLNKMHQFIETLRESKNYHVRLHIAGNDEIAKIAHSINRFISEILMVREQNEVVNNRVQSILEETHDGYFEFNYVTGEYYISPKWEVLLCGSKEYKNESGLKNYFECIHPEYRTKVAELFHKLEKGELEKIEEEYKIVFPNGKEMWILHKGKILEFDENERPVRVASMFFDINERKGYEKKILNLSYRDRLTKLYNRNFLEEKFYELSSVETNTYHIIMGDLNGLKLINDTFGHQEGDRLIATMGRILLECCNEGDIAARWAGDEFIILCVNKTNSYVNDLMEKAKAECSKLKDFSFTISIALGGASSAEESTFGSIMNLAENRMYRSKLIDGQSLRSATITSLESTLYEKSAETEEHTKRIQELALKLGSKINLKTDELNELKLLSLLHDIGKIGIAESILMKPGSLTTEEWTLMKQHTEIGYRIAMATPSLSHVAKKILHHHEKYDGSGYPQGISGESIPTLSRLINVVDSFDVIIHKRIYKEAASVEYAVEELRRCAGTQFDPFLVEQFIEILEEEGIYRGEASPL